MQQNLKTGLKLPQKMLWKLYKTMSRPGFFVIYEKL